jgi:hypothetical protein
MASQITAPLTVPQLYSQLDAFHSSHEVRPLHIFTVFPRVDVESIPDFAYEAGTGAVLERQDEGFYKLTIASAHRRQHAHGFLIDYKKIWNILIRTVESPTVAGNVTKSWLSRMYPVVCVSYMKPDDLLNIMDSLSKVESSTLGLRGYVLRKYGAPESMKKWPMDKPYSRGEIEQTMRNENKLLEAIDFVFKVEGTSFRVRMETSGHFVFYEGGPYCYTNFQRLLLSTFNEIALVNHKFFSNRERRIVNGEAKISQITLKPTKGLTKSDFESLSMHLAKNYSTAVMHSGNPWLLLSLIDNNDGSSFDIHGYSSEIQIVPFNKASAESLMKLISEIYELFPLVKIA